MTAASVSADTAVLSHCVLNDVRPMAVERPPLTPLWELTTLPRPPSRMRRGHPHTPLPRLLRRLDLGTYGASVLARAVEVGF